LSRDWEKHLTNINGRWLLPAINLLDTPVLFLQNIPLPVNRGELELQDVTFATTMGGQVIQNVSGYSCW